MSALADDPEHFVRYATSRGVPATPDSFATRALYRDYLESIWRESAASGRVSAVDGEVVKLHPSNRSWLAELADGGSIEAESVVLGFGAFAPMPISAALGVSNHAAYVNDLWAESTLRLPHKAKTIAVIGSGLTAIDAVLAAEQQGLQGTYTLISRHGLLPQVHGPAKPALAPPAPCNSARELVRSLRQATSAQDDWRPVIDGLRPHIAEYWRALPAGEQARFLRHVRMFWEIHRHRMAPQISEMLAGLVQAGRLTVVRAEIANIRPTDQGLSVALASGKHLDFDAVVNCSGLPPAPRWSSPLLDQLLKDGFAQYDQHRLGIECDQTGKVLGANEHQSLFAIGFLRRGQLYESTAARELAIQARDIAVLLTARTASNTAC